MKVALSLPELLHLALQGEPLPAFVSNPELVGSLLRADVDVHAIPGLTGAARLAVRAVGTVHVDVALAGYADGVAHLAVEARARSIPAHRLASLFVGPINTLLARTLEAKGIPGLAHVVESDGVLTVVVRAQDALDAAPVPPFLRGLVLDSLALESSAVVAHVSLPMR